MSSEAMVVGHYARSDLLTAITDALQEMGKTPETVTIDDLGPADEFHIGGRAATGHLLDQLELPAGSHLLDVGCGIGGPARFVSSRVDRITGIDLTPEYIETGNALNGWLGLADRIELRVGSALDIDVEDATFDGGYMIHVGMNIDDKSALLREVARVLRPGAMFGIYDVMRMTAGDLVHPVPWATEAATGHVAEPERYRQAATDAGLTVVSENNRREAAERFFEGAAARQNPSPLGLQLLMGPTVGEKVKNMVANIRSGLIAPVEMVLQRPAVD